MKILFILSFFILINHSFSQAIVRIKDIARLQGVRKNQLIGTGLVIGLAGTGDKGSATQDMVLNTIRNLGVKLSSTKISPKNAAAVIITADLPPFTSPGDVINVTVSTMGDASSLKGGILLQAPLKAANGQIYAVAQGPLSLGGGNSSHQTVASIPGGAIVEKEVATQFVQNQALYYLLNNKDFTTALRVSDIINMTYGENTAKALTAGKIKVNIPYSFQSNPVEFVSLIDHMKVQVDQVAKVVINERTGTVVLGGNVIISPVAIAHESIIIQIGNQLNSTGQDEPLVEINQGSSVSELVNTLNLMGISTADLIAIIQEIKNAGALQANLEVL
ncbi:flagellar basal body P-ring protein FlgI [bacterium]|nr:flagellar basal body P-ring protein FlgI [bacterium]